MPSIDNRIAASDGSALVLADESVSPVGTASTSRCTISWNWAAHMVELTVDQGGESDERKCLEEPARWQRTLGVEYQCPDDEQEPDEHGLASIQTVLLGMGFWVRRPENTATRADLGIRAYFSAALETGLRVHSVQCARLPSLAERVEPPLRMSPVNPVNKFTRQDGVSGCQA